MRNLPDEISALNTHDLEHGVHEEIADKVSDLQALYEAAFEIVIRGGLSGGMRHYSERLRECVIRCDPGRLRGFMTDSERAKFLHESLIAEEEA